MTQHRPTPLKRPGVRAAARAVLLGCCLLAGAGVAAANPQDRTSAALVTPVDATRLNIETASGTHGFDIELRDTADGRTIGLMHRKTMPVNHGMLFDFEVAEPVAMWMKNTLLPLDMLFIRTDGTIANIATHTQPMSTRVIPASEPVRYVLELNAGTADRIGARPGDQIIHPAIKPVRQ